MHGDITLAVPVWMILNFFEILQFLRIPMRPSLYTDGVMGFAQVDEVSRRVDGLYSPAFSVISNLAVMIRSLIAV